MNIKQRLTAFFSACLILLAFLMIVGWGTTGSSDTLTGGGNGTVLRTLTLLGDGSGAFAGNITMYGQLMYYSFDPGTITPEYDITIKGADLVDVLEGNGADLSSTVTSSHIVANATHPMGIPVAGTYAVAGANMESGSDTTVYLIVKTK